MDNLCSDLGCGLTYVEICIFTEHVLIFFKGRYNLDSVECMIIK